MRLTSLGALKLLEQLKNNKTDNRWIQHCISVGNAAGRIANALLDKGINIDGMTKISLIEASVGVATIVTFIASLLFIITLHNIQVDLTYTEPTTDFDLVGSMSDKDKLKAEELTKIDNHFLDMFKGKQKTTQHDIEIAMQRSKYYEEEKITFTGNHRYSHPQ